jgi:hypothetical protein
LFGKTLGCAHHGGGSDGFVGRDEDNSGIMRRGRGDKRFGGEDVVGDGGKGLSFDERNVLVGGGVKDKARAVKREDLVEKNAIGDAAEIEARIGRDAGKILLKIVEAAFRGFEENGACPGEGETTCERGADRTSGASDEDWVLNEQ